MIKIWHPKPHKKLNTQVLSGPINQKRNNKVQAKACVDINVWSCSLVFITTAAGQSTLLQLRTHLTKV